MVMSSTTGRVETPSAIGYGFWGQNFVERQSFMTRSRLACSLALAAFGLGASAASAQTPGHALSITQEEPKSSRPGPNEPREAPPASVAPAVTVTFKTNSADISDRAKADLDNVAKTITEQRLAQIELRAFAGSDDPTEARRVALARALAVRSYLIDQGVTARIEVGAFSAARNARAGERVEVLAPGP
jgi:outer membrane protein OmpA-like peptidoglycan-associated protein